MRAIENMFLTWTYMLNYLLLIKYIVKKIDIDNSVLGVNSNWELLTPNGFRFYLPGKVGPAWLDATTTAQVKTQFVKLYDEEEFIKSVDNKNSHEKNVENWKAIRPTLECIAQECPILLRKSIEELFPGCLDMTHLTIITISQKANLKSMRRRKETETEKLAKCVSYILQ